MKHNIKMLMCANPMFVCCTCLQFVKFFGAKIGQPLEDFGYLELLYMNDMVWEHIRNELPLEFQATVDARFDFMHELVGTPKERSNCNETMARCVFTNLSSLESVINKMDVGQIEIQKVKLMEKLDAIVELNSGESGDLGIFCDSLNLVKDVISNVGSKL